ncbi:Hpt domain-containing protein [Mongoliitalea lutea]|uniref:HPt domain-containing protein n=1 Tax=Mongoliitalea lutea TaxID=849756 RepID=A0A8J3CU64_9BACT|nr:Hpt domain-containing protein [Mongoliitalea lutea]GHB29378.1 hypothetical protein GCM10008106_07880 [Mongoliitalea lutea]
MYHFINPQIIVQYFGDEDESLIAEMIRMIRDTNLTELSLLDDAFSKEDYMHIKRVCHKSKPSLSYIGAISSRGLVEQIEQDPSSTYEIYELLKVEISSIIQELKHYESTLQ